MNTTIKNSQFGLFFDGTGNNYYVDRNRPFDDYEPTNIAKLFELYKEDKDKAIGKHYINGIGTGGINLRKQGSGDDYSGLEMAFGIGVGKRIELGLNKLKSFCRANKHIKSVVIDVFGFSRGATTARAFINELLEEFNKDSNYLHGVVPTIRFLGIFDTVASIGIKKTENGKTGKYNLDVNPKAVLQACHFVAQHEYRKYFPLHSLKSNNGKLADNFIEKTLLGAHSDVGGGYGPNPTQVYLDAYWVTFGGKTRPKREAHKKKEINAKTMEWESEWREYLAGKIHPTDTLETNVGRRSFDNGPQGRPRDRKILTRYIWHREVDKSLAHVALHAMIKQAKLLKVPLKGLATLAKEVVPPLHYNVPAALKEYASAVYNDEEVLGGKFDSIYPKYIHHSGQFRTPKGGVGLINPNKVRGKNKKKELKREIFSNRPTKGNKLSG